MPLVLTYHSFNTQVKRYLIQNFNILSTDQQTRDIFPQQPFVAYRRDLSLRNMLVHSAENSSTERPGSRACQRPRCWTCEYINPVTAIRGPKCIFTIHDHFYRVSENLVYCISCGRCSHLYIGETGEASEVDLENICEAYATTLLVSLWHNISTPRAPVSQMSSCRVCAYVPETTSNASRLK